MSATTAYNTISYYQHRRQGTTIILLSVHRQYTRAECRHKEFAAQMPDMSAMWIKK